MNPPEKNKYENFLTAKSRQDLATALNVKLSTLMYNFYTDKAGERYHSFEIRKRNGGTRLIQAPSPGVKLIQRKLATVLAELFQQKNCVHGYAKGKSIVTNSSMHVGKNVLINLDLENFFPSIHFGRVKGLFANYPFNFNDIVATTLAHICCYEGTLPQGAPTSPVISNFICRALDNRFIDLAKVHKFTYTRYADDISISTNRWPLSAELGLIKENKLHLSNTITGPVTASGFQINQNKVRYAFKNNRQEVTGLIVNEFPNVNRRYVRQIRAVLHAWEKFGIRLAAKEHFEKYNYKFKNPFHVEFALRNQLVGKIGFIGAVKGKDDPVYKALCERIKELSPQIKLAVVERKTDEETTPIIFAEGNATWKHLKAALIYFQANGLYADLRIRFGQSNEGLVMNSQELLKTCETISKTTAHTSKVICIFGRDTPKPITKAQEAETGFKFWGNNVYSLLLPLPPHRNFKEISIEHFYTDETLATRDNEGKKLYATTEFNKETGKHVTENTRSANKIILKSAYPKIIDGKVTNEKNKNIALSKNAFADHILNKDEHFENVQFEHFKLIFDELQKIIDLQK